MALPDSIVEAIALSNAKSIGEQPAILANLALANQILNTNIVQQNQINQQQTMNQISNAALSKYIALITSDDKNSLKEAEALAKLIEKGFKVTEDEIKEEENQKQKTGSMNDDDLSNNG